MLTLRLLRHTRKAPYYIIQVQFVRASHSHTFEINHHDDYRINSKVIYPKKHENHNKSLSPTQMKFYRETINQIQTFLQTQQISPDSPIDLSIILGTNSAFDTHYNDKTLNELKKWFQKMPHINISNTNNDNFLITRDNHIESIDFISNHYPSITWKNQLNFKTHYWNNKNGRDNTIYRIKELINYYQLHSVFNKHSIESKMIISRGLNYELTNAYNNLIDNKIYKLKMNDFHHLLGNLGLNILSYFGDILCENKQDLIYLHNELINGQILCIEDIKCRYNMSLDINKYGILCQFLIEYYALYFLNRAEYKNIINGETQKISNLEVMPFLFEMKTLVKIGKLLDYINVYYNRLIYNPRYHKINEFDEYYFDIHYNKIKNGYINDRNRNNNNNKLFNKNYRVYSERQLEAGDCSFSVDKCTPDIVLSQPVWINNKPIYWFDAKCTKATNCLYDKKRQYQMYRFTKNYGSGAILAVGSADLSIVGINDVSILDCSHYL